MGTRRPGIFAAIASMMQITTPLGIKKEHFVDRHRIDPDEDNEQHFIGVDPAKPGSDKTVEAEARLLPDGTVQYSKLNKAEAKRYRKRQKALRDQTRSAAGMVC